MISRIAIYVVAHQDDWQLFMEPAIGNDILDPQCKVIIIHTTAGDAGENRRFWRAREEGAINSLLFRLSGCEEIKVKRRYAHIQTKKIYWVSIANCALYFLRLPDGGMYGDGFQFYNYQSLSRIRLKQIDAITAVDQANTFDSFREISSLISDILERELRTHTAASVEGITLSFPEYDDSISPEDHSDHLNTALLLQDIGLYASVKKYAFVHYAIRYSPSSLVGEKMFWKVGMFSVYHQAVRALHGHSTIDESPLYHVWSVKDSLRREIKG